MGVAATSLLATGVADAGVIVPKATGDVHVSEERMAIASTGAASPKDMGKVISVVMAAFKGRAEGGTVSKLVKEALASG